MAQWYNVSCKNCGYKTELVVGSSVTSESLKDLNEDSADFRIFECTHDHELFAIDVHDRDFDNTCPVCGTAVTEVHIDEIDGHACPGCGSKALKIEPVARL